MTCRVAHSIGLRTRDRMRASRIGIAALAVRELESQFVRFGVGCIFTLARCAAIMSVAPLTLLANHSCALAQRGEFGNRAVIAGSLLNNHLADSAEKIVDGALATDSLSAPLWCVKAKILSTRGDRKGGEAALRRVLAISPDYLEAHQALAEIFCDSGLADSARKYLALPLRADSSNPRVIYYDGRIHQQDGHLDTAVARYSQAYDMVSASELLPLPICPGYRVQPLRLRTTGTIQIHHPSGNPTLFLFWATWSPSSLKALKAVIEQLPKTGITWKFLPVNVDDRGWLRSTRARVEAKARELGFNDPVPLDSGLLLFDRLGLASVPALVATNVSGDVDEVAFGWSKKVSDLVIKALLSGGDSTSRPSVGATADCDRALRRLGSAWLSWEQSQMAAALTQISRTTRACSIAAYPYALSASWRWWEGDTLRAGQDAYKAIKADSADPWGWLAVAEIERRRDHRDPSREAAWRALMLDSSLAAGWVTVGRLAASAGDTTAVRRSIKALERLKRFDPALSILRAALLQRAGLLLEAATQWRGLLDPRI